MPPESSCGAPCTGACRGHGGDRGPGGRPPAGSPSRTGRNGSPGSFALGNDELAQAPGLADRRNGPWPRLSSRSRPLGSKREGIRRQSPATPGGPGTPPGEQPMHTRMRSQGTPFRSLHQHREFPIPEPDDRHRSSRCPLRPASVRRRHFSRSLPGRCDSGHRGRTGLRPRRDHAAASADVRFVTNPSREQRGVPDRHARTPMPHPPPGRTRRKMPVSKSSPRLRGDRDEMSP